MFFHLKKKYQMNWIRSADRIFDLEIVIPSADGTFHFEIVIRSADRIFYLEILIRSADRIFDLEIVIQSADRIFDLEILIWSADTNSILRSNFWSRYRTQFLWYILLNFKDQTNVLFGLRQYQIFKITLNISWKTWDSYWQSFNSDIR